MNLQQAPEIEFDVELDTSGLYCPLPILRAKKQLNTMSDNSILKLVSTDPNSQKDIAAFTKQIGFCIVYTEHNDDMFIFYIKKTPR